MPQPFPATRNTDQSLTQAERTARAEAGMIETAIELLNTVGIQGTTLVAIGDKAGYSRGLVSHHFGSKAGLFRAVLKRITANWTADLHTALDDRTGIAAIGAAIDAHLAHVLRHPEYIRAQNILWGAALDPSSEFKPNVAEFMQIQRESVAAWVRGGQKSGEILPEINPQRIAEQYYGGLIGINSQWLVSPDFDLAAAYTDFKRNMVRLLSAPTTQIRKPDTLNREERQ
ncbi:MAG: TetR/AcrR family transcriptional regulator [Xanthomonadales bacterium]|nr:TetR/AcrR family transcriptional regulator [Xanthomonadales bacterium]